MRRTVVVGCRIAADAARLEAARARAHGLQVLPIERVASRLAGGFLAAVDGDVLSQAVLTTLDALRPAELNDLQPLRELPGLPGALAATLSKIWQAGMDLPRRAALQPCERRLATLACIEAAVLARLPPALRCPADLVAAALARIGHAPAVLGPVELRGMAELDPCWRPLVAGLARVVPVTWRAGPRPVPGWVAAAGLQVVHSMAARPDIRVVSCATARHEIIEAVRWVRGLLASGTVRAQDIALGAASTAGYDALVLAVGAEANLEIHFAHGRPALATREGQAAAALADVLLRGLSQERVRRLSAAAHAPGTPFAALPNGWQWLLPQGAPLGTAQRWRQALAMAPVPPEVSSVLLPVLDLLARGTRTAVEAGELLLRGPALALWRRALVRAHAGVVEGALGQLRVGDPCDSAVSVAWMPASALAACPRSHVWLLGLNARSWPRGAAEDPLLPAHLVPAAELDPCPTPTADREAFAAILATTGARVVCSFARREAGGRLLGRSPLLPAAEPDRLRRARLPEHAMSEPDRMMARPAEFATTLHARSAEACWQAWHTPELTPHDGLVRAGHPLLAQALARVHSATSLRLLLRDPLGFTWRYALGWRAPESGEETMTLDPAAFGELVHAMLDTALPAVEGVGGLGRAEGSAIASVVASARDEVAARWEAERAVPPAILWAHTLDEAAELATTALCWPLAPLPGQRSHAELAFGQRNPGPGRVGPWDMMQVVVIPGTDLRIGGRLDRLDLDAEGRRARVVDYKTGRPREPGVLAGGQELQRCLYAYAVAALLGPGVETEAALLYPREGGGYHALPDPVAALAALTQALMHACAGLRRGDAVPGVDAGDSYSDLRFALPASPGSLLAQKQTAAAARMGDAALVWGAA